MEIRVDDHIVTTTMRTPGHDYELAVGFCITEGLLADAPIRSVRYCATGSAEATHYNVVTVSTGGVAPVPEARLRASTSSCGLCGSASLDGDAGITDVRRPRSDRLNRFVGIIGVAGAHGDTLAPLQVIGKRIINRLGVGQMRQYYDAN